MHYAYILCLQTYRESRICVFIAVYFLALVQKKLLPPLNVFICEETFANILVQGIQGREKRGLRNCYYNVWAGKVEHMYSSIIYH